MRSTPSTLRAPSRARAPGAANGRGSTARARAVQPPKAPDAYRGALFPGVEVPDNDLARSLSALFPWGNGARVTEKVLGDLLKPEVRAAPLFVPLYDYYRRIRRRVQLGRRTEVVRRGERSGGGADDVQGPGGQLFEGDTDGYHGADYGRRVDSGE